MFKKGLAASLIAAVLGTSAPAFAEGTIRIVEQFGTLYTPFHVMKAQKLIEKHGQALGLDIKVDWAKLSGGSAVNDALLSGNVDVAAAGIGPFLTLWDRTRGSANEVKIIGALGAQPNYLVTNNPNVRTLKDFTKADKIALPAVGVSVQARILQMAAQQAFGPGKEKSLDDLTITLPHPDATAALLSGSTEITAHVSNQPYQDQALKDPKVHKVFSSYDVLGGPVTPTFVYSTVRFKTQNPKTYKAFFDAFREATAWVDAHKAEAAAIYVKTENSKLDPAFVTEVLSDPQVKYTLTPLGSQKFADFLAQISAIKNRPASWKDYTFDDLHNDQGS